MDWDDEVPDALRLAHKQWREELPLLASVQLPRCYFRAAATTSIQLHGFCDASQTAYAAVVYIRATYAHNQPSCQLVAAKTRVAPIKQRTIPELELCGAVLLTELLESTMVYL